MTTTPNFGLKKPAQTDFYNVDDFNANADIIDAALKNAQEGTLKTAHNTDPTAHEDIREAITGLSGNLTAHNSDPGAHGDIRTEINGKVNRAGDTMQGKLYAQNNTDYTTYQVRNIALSTTAAVPTGNGALLGVYS